MIALQEHRQNTLNQFKVQPKKSLQDKYGSRRVFHGKFTIVKLYFLDEIGGILHGKEKGVDQ